jgi:hypothetical protein
MRMHRGIRAALVVAAAVASWVVAPSSPARADIPIAPEVTVQPQLEVYTGAAGPLDFTASAYGVPQPTVQWESASGRNGPWTAVAGATGTTLAVSLDAGNEGHAYRAVFTNPSGTAISRPAKLVSTANWMHDLGDDIAGEPLTELTIPGTHDMGTYGMPSDGPFALDSLAAVCDDYDIPNSICDSYARAQDGQNATQQLNDGIRYFDLRVCGNSAAFTTTPPDLVALSQDPVTCHGFEAAHFRQILSDTAAWADTHPAELVILDVNHLFDTDLGTIGQEVVDAFTRSDGSSMLVPPQYCTPGDKTSDTCAGDLTLNVLTARRSDHRGPRQDQNVIVNVENDGSPTKACIPQHPCWTAQEQPDTAFYDSYPQLWGRPVTAPVDMARCTVAGAFSSCFGNSPYNIDVLDHVAQDTRTRQSFAEPHPAYTFEHFYVQFLQTTPDGPYIAQNSGGSLKDMALDDNGVIAPDLIGTTDGSWHNCQVIRGPLGPDPAVVPDCMGAHEPENVNILALNFYDRVPHGPNFNLVHAAIDFDEYARTAPVVDVFSWDKPGSTGWYNATSVGGAHQALPVTVTAEDYRYPVGIDSIACTDGGATLGTAITATTASSSTATGGLGDGVHPVHCEATDGANQGQHGQGNSGDGPSSIPDVTFRVDTTAPTVTCADHPVVAIGDPSASIVSTVSDATSGPAAATVTTPVSAGQLGTFSATVSAQDVAGNVGTATCAYAVAKATPVLTTHTAVSVPLGGQLSDTAALTGGYQPGGTVAFSLYGPQDPDCHSPLTTSTVAVSDGSASSGGAASSAAVQATSVGTYNWIASYSGDADNNPVVTTCGQEQVVVTPQQLTGRAVGISLTGRVLGRAVQPVPPTPDTGPVNTTASSSVAPPCVARISGLAGVQAVCASVTTNAAWPATSTAKASIGTVVIALASVPVITVRGVQAGSTTSCAGSVGSVTIGYLKVGTKVVIAKTTVIKANTTLIVGAVKLVLNAQQLITGPDHGLTVDAIRLTVNESGSTTVSAVLASAESDIGNCP